MMKACIVIPSYNEEKRIGRTLEAYSLFFSRKKDIDYLILVVINGTKDRTEEVVKDFRRRYGRIEYLNFSRGGKGFAITEGFRYALEKDFDLIGFVDADMATAPVEYYRLIQQIENYDGIIADRYMKGSKIIPKFSFRRIAVSRTFNFIARSLFQLSYGDTQTGAKVFKKNVIQNIINKLTITQWAYDIDLLYACKKEVFRIKSVPTIWEEVGGSKLNILKTSIEMFFAIIQLRILRSPFKIFFKVLKPMISIIYKRFK